MIKGILLSVSLASFIVSLALSFSSWTNRVQENLITGNFIGYSSVVNYSVIGLILSFIACCLIVFWMRN